MPSDAANPLREIADTAAAPAEIRRLYDDIRQVTGVPLVNQLYRRLAACPGLLAYVWDALRPQFAGGHLDGPAADLIGAVERELAAIPAVPLRAGSRDAAMALTQGYLRMNARNLIAFQSLFQAGIGPGRAMPASAPVPWGPVATPLPPLPPEAALDAGTRARLARLNALGEDAPRRHEASFWRHLATCPETLAAVDARLATLSQTVDFRGYTDATRAAARGAARRLPGRPLAAPARQAAAGAVGGLVDVTIPKMIPLGLIVRRDLSRSIEEPATA